MPEPDSHGWCDDCHTYAILARTRIKGRQLCLWCHRKATEAQKP